MLTEAGYRSGASDRAETPSVAFRAVVAIPVCNEEERIGACLRALAGQIDVPAGGFGVVLFLNNCVDGTAAAIADALRPGSLLVRIVERNAAEANAGWARREAMEEAARWLDAGGAADAVLLTTDADSRVPPDWIARNLDALDAGADAVAGRIALDPDEAARLPAALHARGRLEGTYETLLRELSAILDPVAHDPWPCHGTASGATLAVRRDVHARVGGMPALAVGEDKAFVARLASHDARIRHAPDIVVVTSGRLDGRAPGGAADTMKLRCEAPESPCDPSLEALSTALFRSVARRGLRRLHAAGRLAWIGLWAPVLAIPRSEAAAIARLDRIGEVLAAAEERSPRLAYHPLQPRELPAQIRRAKAALILFRGARRLPLAVRAWIAARRPADRAVRTLTGGAGRPDLAPSIGRIGSVGSESTP